MITVDSVTFDLTDCSLQKEEPGEKVWVSSDDVVYTVQLRPAPSERPFNWKFDLTDPVAAADFYRQQCTDNRGAMLSMDVTSAGGVEVLRGLFKYRAPIPQSMALCFVGILYVPFQKCCFQINVEAMEMGMTGVREATVMMIEEPEPPADAPEPILLKDGEELFDRLRATPLSKLPADEERWDQSFPDHPLSQVRTKLTKVIDTLQVAPEVQSLAPFRVRKGWRFWGR